ncbi:MAG: radical SAM protein [Candidatus Diapherotrites archaeon]|nr:radical SAM protein [Candidatus Diapherotrites archaeon]
MSSIIPINRECNLNCLYCSSFYEKPPSKEEIIRQILNENDQVVFTGGEPLLCKDLLRYIKLAKRQGVNEIELQSNGTLFYYKGVAEKLVKAGVTIFNIALPSHKENICDQITQTKGLFEKRIVGIKNLLALGANVRITLVICTLNQDHLYEYTKFVHRNFPGIKILEFNTVKLRGRCLENKWLVPNLNDLDAELYKAMAYCDKEKINLLVDGVPLCHMQGFEKYSVDLRKIISSKVSRLHAEKEKAKACNRCSLRELCLGLRKGYLKLHGSEQVKPSNKNPEEIKKLFI